MAEKIHKERSMHTSIHYSINYNVKPFTYEDTLNYKADVELVRVPEDTLFKGLIYIEMDTVWYGYNLVKIFYGNKHTNTIIYDSASLHPEIFIKSTTINDLVDESFLNLSNGLKQALNDSTMQVSSNDTLIDNIPCIGIKVHFPDTEPLTDKYYFAAVEKATYAIKRKTYSVMFQGNEQYQEWNYSNIKYGNEIRIPQLEIVNVSDYLMKHLNIENKHDENDLINYNFSTFKGTLLNTNEEIHMNDIRVDFVILDFWYTACYPCIKSIPAVDSLALAFKDRNVRVYGVNMIDDPEKSKARIEKFLSKNKMSYETIMVDNQADKNIPVHAYPTLFILDKDYKLIHQEVGFNSNLYQEISAFLNERL
ncbi:MAG TPA: TlpA disulfide reductase family protein [Saprospiraceae bacterium]|nr:TlpA disulfide reductase family protein [Saprospiraceae bacterium]